MCWYRVAPPSRLWHRGTPVPSTSTRRTMTFSISLNWPVHIRACGHKSTRRTGWQSSIPLRPTKSSPATQRTGGHRRWQEDDGRHGYPTRSRLPRGGKKGGRARPRRRRGVQVIHSHSTRTLEQVIHRSLPRTACSPKRYTKLGKLNFDSSFSLRVTLFRYLITFLDATHCSS